MPSDIYGYAVTQMIVAPGASNARLIQPIAGERNSSLKYFSGGSLEVFNAPVGATTAVTLGLGYLLAEGEIINSDGPARYYLAATGATTIAYLLRGMSQPG